MTHDGLMPVRQAVELQLLEQVALQSRRDDRRDAILDVAKACFQRDGYAATSMSTIAATLGGSKGTLYNYFKSKDELFEAFVAGACDRLSRELFASSAEGLDVRQRLIHIARTFLTVLMSPDALAVHRLVVGESGRFPQLGKAFYKAGPQVGLARIAAEFQSMMDRGELRCADAQVAAQQFKDLSISGVYQLRLWGVIEEPTLAEIAGQAETAVDTFLRAYGAEPGKA
jgi:TetR/AcrR family transcriptional repressor of mexJK operon